jgi:hypothetical protein
MYGEGFERLSEDQKRRVRDALAKAWGRPEVADARDRMMKANEEMREAIHGALKEIDPEIATLLANMRGPEPWGGRGEMPKMPPPDSPDFPNAVVKRLEMEVLIFSPPDRREEARSLHGTLLGQPEISAVVKDTQELEINNQPVAFRLMDNPLLDEPVPTFTGIKRVNGVLGYDREQAIEISQTLPLKMTLLGLDYRIAVYSGT